MPNKLVTPYFPKSHGPSNFRNSHPDRLPERPQEIGPIVDTEHVNTPIDVFDEHIHNANYKDRPANVNVDLPPEQSADFSDRFLYPSLTKHERLRLTLLWYYTRDVTDDREFMSALQEKLDLVQHFMGWEFAIIGLSSEHVYTRLVTAGLPLAILPRRESTCSHTINQPSGSVFMLPDMAGDWRFQNSPPVEEGGLRSYAGAQVRCRAEQGDDVAIGALCIASNTPQPPLESSQQAALVRFADMISAEIVNRSRESRKNQRHIMGEMLTTLQAKANPENVQNLIREAIKHVYPNVEITIQESSGDSISIPGRNEPIPLAELSDGLWEDSQFIDEIIATQNFRKLETDKTVRAVVSVCLSQPHTRYLVVSSNEIQFVFDDVDSWFVERCALVLRNTMQEGRLKEALDAKDRFLRGITHQLRTPIHGVLGSVDLLAEELASRNLLEETPLAEGPDSQLTASSFLKTIRDSGRELMSTVNNMLKLNRWTEHGSVVAPATLQSFNQVESDILHDVTSTIPERELAEISLMFENQLATDDRMVVIDLVLLRECVQALVINALQYTKRGAVIITISGAADYSLLTFDIVDTGCGIKPEDRKRIFEPYEKVDDHTRGAGLGLTIASKIAHAINGEVSLFSSEFGMGSHFRAEFYNPGFACPIDRKLYLPPHYEAIPKRFHVLPAETERPDLVMHFASYLSHRGFEDAGTPEGSMIIITYTPDLDEFRKLVASVSPRQVAMTLMPAGASTTQLHGVHEVRFFEGPFLTTRLEEIIKELDEVYKRLESDPLLGETASGTCNKNESARSADEEATSPADSQPRALIVDDNTVNLRIIRMYCEKRKIPYVTAEDGRQAVNAFEEAANKNEPFNLVLMDLQMPICDGVDATREIRELEHRHYLQPSVVFMITGQDSQQDKTRSFDAGATEYYVKPMSIKTLDRGVGGYFPGFANGLVKK